MKNIVILCGARDYHAMDWYRTIRKLSPNRDIKVLTDLIGGESFDIIIKKDDKVDRLLIIDNFLFSKQSTLGNIWRNILKLIVLPIQVLKLKKYSKLNPNTIYHAHPMYYMVLCMLARVKFIGTPQGSEILVRPYRSKIYKYFAKKALRAAEYVTVDSINMQNEIYKISGVKAIIIQNGVDTDTLTKINSNKRDKITSIRGMTPLYRIEEIIKARNNVFDEKGINFIYPFGEKEYIENNLLLMQNVDNNIGRLNKNEMYKLLSESYLVLSIPKSDSSPRSVYESIFLGCCVAVTQNEYIDILPQCMKDRLYIVNLDDKEWFKKAHEKALELKEIQYIPSNEALEMFNQDKSMLKAIEVLYK
jgi:hypothetical protein